MKQYNLISGPIVIPMHAVLIKMVGQALQLMCALAIMDLKTGKPTKAKRLKKNL